MRYETRTIAIVATVIRLLMYVLRVVLFIPIMVITIGGNVKHLDNPYVARGTGVCM